MPEHVHDWELWNDYTYAGETAQWAECRCGEKLLGDEMVRRLNATERLGKTAAALAANMIREYAAGEDNEITDELFAYASALEKD